MIKLKNINVDTTMIEQITKVSEEYNEFLVAILKKDTNNSIEEFYDVMQSMLEMLNKVGLNADYVESQYYKHLDKLKDRPRKFKPFNEYCQGQICCSKCPLGQIEGGDEDICETAYETAINNNGKLIISI